MRATRACPRSEPSSRARSRRCFFPEQCHGTEEPVAEADDRERRHRQRSPHAVETDDVETAVHRLHLAERTHEREPFGRIRSALLVLRAEQRAPLLEWELTRLVVAAAEDQLRGLVVEEEVTLRADQEDRQRELT